MDGRGTELPSSEELEGICVKFILTLPASELESFERLLFCIEQAWWHYEDHVIARPEHRNRLKSLSLREFADLIFEKVPGLEPLRPQLDDILQRFNEYKKGVPVRGAILLDPGMEKCLLVRGLKSQSAWGFPRGKVSAGESDAACAVRECWEETGLDIADRLVESDFIDVRLGQQDTRLFIIQGVDESTGFQAQVPGEIGAFGWHSIAHLPASYDESKQAFVNDKGGRHKFFNVWPYIKPLRGWIHRTRKQQSKPVRAAEQPGSTTHVPGQALLNFKLDRKDVMRHLTFGNA